MNIEALKNKNLTLYSNTLIVALWTIVLSYANFAKGFDFTDSTLTYHFSLRILNGDIPFKDFHTTLMPLAYYIEAIFHYLFGVNYIVNAYLGLALKFLQIFYIFKIFNIFYKHILTSMIFTIFMTSLFSSQHIYFSFTPLAITLSIISTYYALLSVDNSKYLIIFGFFTGLTILAKQNLGVVLIIAYFIFMFIMIIKNRIRINNMFMNLGLFLLGLMIVILPFMLYFKSLGVLSEIGYILLTGSERKGLSELSLIEFINTLIPVQRPKLFIISLIAAFMTFYVFKTKKHAIFHLAISAILLLSVMAIFKYSKYYDFAIQLLFYDSAKIILIAISFYLLLTKTNVNKTLYVLTIFLSAIVFTHELGWIGRGYTLPIASGLFVLLLPYIFNELNLNCSMLRALGVMNKIFSIGIIIFILSFLFFPKENLYRDFNTNITYSLKPYLSNYEMSAEHRKAIIEFKEIYDEKCGTKNIFVFPWAPILYDLIGAKNPTRFDLPYHDWLTEKEADEAISVLNTNPPCLIIIEKNSLSKSGRSTPFPAHGMRKMEAFFKNGFLENYIPIKNIQTFGKDHVVFLKKQEVY
ncbi:MAG: hypothetical protein GY834_12995 [Bacteroidetes bacterium]|nr:hypothetical protein [Bacteroidota bacterium]